MLADGGLVSKLLVNCTNPNGQRQKRRKVPAPAEPPALEKIGSKKMAPFGAF